MMPRHPQREAVLNAWANGARDGQIVRDLGISFGSVSSIITKARAEGDSRAARRRIRDDEA